MKNSPDIAAASQGVAALDFPDSHRLRSRDVFRLATRVWPFIRPYRKHLGLLMLAIMPALPAGLFVLALTRIFYDVFWMFVRCRSSPLLVTNTDSPGDTYPHRKGERGGRITFSST